MKRLPLEERLRDEYEGGDFIIKIYSPNPRNKNRPSMRKSIKVSVAIVKRNHAPVLPMAQQSNDTDAIMQMIAANNKSQQEMMMRFIEMNANNKSEGMGLQEVIQLTTLLNGNANRDDPIKLVRDLLATTGEMKALVGTDEKPNDNMSMLNTGLSAIIELANANKGATAPAAVAPPPNTPAAIPPKAQQAPPAPSAQPTGQDENMFVKMAIAKHFKFLVKQATEQKDPLLYAEVTLDQIPEAYYVKLYDLIEQSNFMDKFAEIEPAVLGHEAWFIDLRNGLLAALSDDETPENTGQVDEVDELGDNPDSTTENGQPSDEPDET